MDNNKVTTADGDMLEWIAAVRDMSTLYGRPMVDDDPRLEFTRDQGYPDELGSDALTRLYWRHADLEMPPVPLPRPSWATTVEVDRSSYPEVMIVYRGDEWRRGQCAVTISQMVTVFVDATESDLNGPVAVGTIVTSPAALDVIAIDEPQTPADALDFAEAITRAARGLEQA